MTVRSARLRLGADGRRDAVRGEHEHAARWHLVHLGHEDRAALLQLA